MIKLKISKWEDYSRLFIWVLNAITYILIRQRKREMLTQRRRCENGEERFEDAGLDYQSDVATGSWNASRYHNRKLEEGKD